jgi:FixJ family two-component response regulator
MPEVNGDQLAALIKELQPREPVIMLTGFADVLTGADKPSKNVDFILSKPARLEDLRNAIIAVMPRD